MAEKSDSSKMIILKCPQCGGQLDLDPDKEVATCPFCKTKLLIVRSIEQNNVINYNIRIDNTGKKEQDPFPEEDPEEQRRIRIMQTMIRAAGVIAAIVALLLIFKACGTVIDAFKGDGNKKETGEEVAQDTDSETGTENGQDPQEASSEGRVIEVPPYGGEVREIDPIPQKTESIAAAEIKEFPVRFTERGQEVRFDVTVPNPGSVYVYIAEIMKETCCRGTTLILTDRGTEVQGAVSVDMAGLSRMFNGFEQGILDLTEPASYTDIESITERIFLFADKIKEGGRIIIPESSYVNMPYGIDGMEAVLLVAGLRIEMPLAGDGRALIASVTEK